MPGAGMNTDAIKTLTDIGTDISTILAAGAGLWWFLYTTQFKQRIQFDLECSAFPAEFNGNRILELRFVLENKGFVEHRIYDLEASVHVLDGAQLAKSRSSSGEVIFPKTVFSRRPIVSREFGYYFVRPGVRQVITHIALIPGDAEMVRVTAGFRYRKESKYPHTARRVFSVTSKKDFSG
jgi:hypothetical protein